MNTYAPLDALKSPSVLNITGADADTRLLSLLESASRVVDRFCNRHFYALSATRRFDGGGGPTLLIPDLISVDADGLRTDDDRDRTFETTWSAADYRLRPPNASPASAGLPESRPFTSVEVDVDAGTKAAWPKGRETVRIAGEWGWGRRLKRAAETAGAVADAAAASITVSVWTDVEAGHTVLIDSEQLYVRGCVGSTLTVARGVNGTAAASHGGGAAIDIYEYPAPVVESTILHAVRLWRRGDGASGSALGLDADARLMLGHYRKAPVGVGV